jgi:tetratricopeptide (TPR) repeat protein
MRTGFRSGLRTCLTLCFVFSAVSLIAQKSGDEVGAITAALRAGEFTHALQLLQPLLQHSPGSAQLWTLQGLAYSGEGHKKEALASFQAALKVSADYLPALEGAAQIEYDAGSKEAAPLLHHVLRLRPNDATSHAMLAVLAYKEGDCATAVQHFEQSGALTDSQPAALQEYGSCLVKQKQLDRAIGVFEKALDLSAGDTKARYLLAAVQLMAERPKDAVVTLTPLLQANTSDENVLHLAASAYEASGDTPEAVRTLRQAIVTNPRNADLYIDFANLSMDHQSFQAGIDLITSGLAFQPDSASLYVARGVLYVQLAEYEKAEADFEKADTLDPRQSIGAAALGLAALQKNDLDAALATVRSKLARKPTDPYLLYLQADILSQKGPDPGSSEFQAAIRSASRAVSIQPTLVPARDLLAKLYLQAGQNAQAAQQARKALEHDPKDQTALYHLIQGLRKTGDDTELPALVKRLAELRQEATREEREHNRYKLVVGDGSAPK